MLAFPDIERERGHKCSQLEMVNICKFHPDVIYGSSQYYIRRDILHNLLRCFFHSNYFLHVVLPFFWELQVAFSMSMLTFW